MEDFIRWEMHETGRSRQQILDDHAKHQAEAETRLAAFLANLDEN